MPDADPDHIVIRFYIYTSPFLLVTGMISRLEHLQQVSIYIS